MLRSILSMATLLAFPAAAAAHTALVPHAHPHGASFILSTEATLFALFGAVLFVLALGTIVNRKPAVRRVRREK